MRLSTLCPLFVSLLATTAGAQYGGSRAGVGGAGGLAGLPDLEPTVATGYITVDGRAELRVQPTELRCVLAVTGEGQTANECRAAVDNRIARVLAAWKRRGIAAEAVNRDFIAILPRYEWRIERRGDVEVGVEQRVGFRMQTNLHLAVPTEAAAQVALDDAFAEGVTDIIAFDYWSDEIEEARNRARAAAVKAARAKADVLLSVFDERPKVVNVRERTDVVEPASLYESFENADAEQAVRPSRRDIPFVRALRPKNTYYRGLAADADVGAGRLPMRPEITVVSTVRLYFLSPAAGVFNEDD